MKSCFRVLNWKNRIEIVKLDVIYFLSLIMNVSVQVELHIHVKRVFSAIP